MTDSHALFKPADPGRIDVQSQEELHYWGRELQCTQARLVHAVTRVGNHVSAVRDYLHAHPRTASHPPHSDS